MFLEFVLLSSVVEVQVSIQSRHFGVPGVKRWNNTKFFFAKSTLMASHEVSTSRIFRADPAVQEI